MRSSENQSSLKDCTDVCSMTVCACGGAEKKRRTGKEVTGERRCDERPKEKRESGNRKELTKEGGDGCVENGHAMTPFFSFPSSCYSAQRERNGTKREDPTVRLPSVRVPYLRKDSRRNGANGRYFSLIEKIKTAAHWRDFSRRSSGW